MNLKNSSIIENYHIIHVLHNLIYCGTCQNFNKWLQNEIKNKANLIYLISGYETTSSKPLIISLNEMESDFDFALWLVSIQKFNMRNIWFYRIGLFEIIVKNRQWINK